jgi:hypothetical protein
MFERIASLLLFLLLLVNDVLGSRCEPQVDLSKLHDLRCGNGVCQIGESCSTCERDCGVCWPLFNARVRAHTTGADEPLATVLTGPNRRRLNGALGCGAPTFDESACLSAVSSVQHGSATCNVTGTLSYAVFSKQKNTGPRKGEGNQGAMFLHVRAASLTVWFGVREPLCELREKNRHPSSEQAADEFGFMMLAAYAVDVLLDGGFVPTTALVELDVDELAAASTPASLPMLCAFLELGAVNVLERRRRVLGVAQATKRQAGKDRPAHGVMLIREDEPTLMRAIVEFSVAIGEDDHERHELANVYKALQMSTRLGQMCSAQAGRRSSNSACNTAFRLLLFGFLAGVPLRDHPTAIINLVAPDDAPNNAKIPMLVGDCDRGGQFFRCRSRLPNSPNLFPRTSDAHKPSMRIGTAWMKVALLVLMQSASIDSTPVDRIIALQRPFGDAVVHFLQTNLTSWSRTAALDPQCLEAAGLSGDVDAFLTSCMSTHAASIVDTWRERSEIE